jgi:N-acetylneuraminate lyase
MVGAGEIELSIVPAYVDHLVRLGIRGLYVLGTTGEGASLTGAERKDVAEAFVKAARGRIPVIIQVGHNSLAEASELAAHAQQVGADGVSAFAPSYFKCDTVDCLLECMAQIASGAPKLPFYFYHAPGFTGVRPDLMEMLGKVDRYIPNFVGVKFTDQRVYEFQSCLAGFNGRYDILWGSDEMLLSGLSAGTRGAVGSTYNIAAPIYHRVIASFDKGDLESARAWQLKSVRLVEVLLKFPLFAAIKEILSWHDLPLGPCRLPLGSLASGQAEALRRELEKTGLLQHLMEVQAKDAVVSGE